MYGMTTFTKSYHHVMLDKDPRMTKPMKEVYCFLLSFQETESISQIFPSNQKIAEFTCNSDRTVKRATKALQDIGLIQKTRRFNSSSIFKVMPYATKDTGATQPLTIGPQSPQVGATVSSYKITNKIKDKISLEEEGQNPDASLSHGMNETKIHSDESVSDLNLDEGIFEKNSVKKEEVTEAYASMRPASLPEDDEPLDHDDDDLAYSSSDEKEDSLPEFEYDDLSKPVYFDEDAEEKALDEKSLFKSGFGRVTPTSRQKERAKYNRSQSHRSNPNY